MKIYNFSFRNNRFKLLTALCLSGFVLCSSSAHSNEDIEGAREAKRMRFSATCLLPENILQDCIYPFLDQSGLLRLEEISPFLKVKEQYWQSLVKKRLPPYKNIELGTYPEHLLSYKILNFLVAKLQKLTSLEGTKDFISKESCRQLVTRTFSPEKAACLKGLVAEMTQDLAGALRNYLYAEEKGILKATQQLNMLLYKGSLGQGMYALYDRFQLLLERANSGDKEAEKYVSKALYKGALGHNQYSLEERLKKLMEREAKGDSYAQKLVNKAFIEGTLGQFNNPDEDRLAILMQRADAGDAYASKAIDEMLHDGDFFHETYSDEDRLAILMQRADAGDTYASKAIARDIYEGCLGFEVYTKEQRFEMLQQKAKEGDPYAAEFVAKATSLWDVVLAKYPKEERFKFLVEKADTGDVYAQQRIADSLTKADAFLDLDKYTEEERLQILLQREALGDKTAASKIAFSLQHLRGLGGNKYTAEEAFQLLYQRALSGNLYAQGELQSYGKPVCSNFTLSPTTHSQRLWKSIISRAESGRDKEFFRLFFDFLNEIIYPGKVKV